MNSQNVIDSLVRDELDSKTPLFTTWSEVPGSVNTISTGAGIPEVYVNGLIIDIALDTKKKDHELSYKLHRTLKAEKIVKVQLTNVRNLPPGEYAIEIERYIIDPHQAQIRGSIVAYKFYGTADEEQMQWIDRHGLPASLTS